MKKIFYSLCFTHPGATLFFKKKLLKNCAAFFLLVVSVLPANAQVGQALSLDGGSDYVRLPFILSGSYTKEAWINVNSGNFLGVNNIVSGSDEAFYVYQGTLYAGPTANLAAVQDAVPLTVNTWYHAAVTYDSVTQTMILYKDGVQVGYANPIPGSVDTAVYIGAYQAGSSGGNFNGLIDEVRIWNVARTQAQIMNDMDSSLTGDEPGLIAYYNFNQGIDGNIINATDTLYDSANHKCGPYNGVFENVNGSTTSNWVTPGAPLLGASLLTYPNLKVSGNSTCIDNADTVASSDDSTDFGTSAGTGVFVKYTIQNNGMAALNIDSVHIGGTDSSFFIITSAPASTVAPGGSTSFIIEFAPTAIGLRYASINIYSNDSDAIPFSYLIKGNATAVLPVTLQSFTGNINGATVKLTWKTSAEINNKGFEILRSADGVSNWQQIGYVATGNASSNVYNFTDESPLPGVNTYRLREIDANGNTTLSSVVAVNFNTKGLGIIVYPNPASDVINLQVTDNNLLNTPVQLRTATGNLIATIILSNNYQQVNLGNLSNGVYFISFSNGEVKRIIKQ